MTVTSLSLFPFVHWRRTWQPTPVFLPGEVHRQRSLVNYSSWGSKELEITARRSTQSILKEISPGCSLEGMMLKLKLQYFGHLIRRVDSLEKTDAGRDWGQEEKGMTEDEMAGWHHRLNGRESEWTPGAGDGQGGLACCDSWGHKESDTTEQLNWTELITHIHTRTYTHKEKENSRESFGQKGDQTSQS